MKIRAMSENNTKRIAVIGAGMTGLTAALKLAEQGFPVTVYEKTSVTGGLASGFPVGKDVLDRFYHHFFTSDTELIELIESLQLGNAIGWHQPGNAIYLDNTLYPFTTPLDLLRFTPLSFVSRIRMGMLVVLSRFVKDFHPYEKITAREWIIKRGGEDTYKKVWGPLLKAKFDADADTISGTWIWNKFKLRGSSRGKNINKEELGYLKGGFERLAKALVHKLEEKGSQVFLDSPVKGIKKTTDGFYKVLTSKGEETFHQILYTGSPASLAGLDTNLPESYIGKLLKLPAKANLCLALELSEGLSPYYWITIAQDGLPFVLAIEHTRLVGMGDYGSHIVYLSRYIDPADPFFKASDDEIIRVFLDGLKKVFPAFSAKTVKKATLSRAEYAQPVVSMGYEKLLLPYETPLKGFYTASMSQIYPEDRGLNYAVRLGIQVSEEMAGALKD